MMTTAHGRMPRPLLWLAALVAGLVVAVSLLASAQGASGADRITVTSTNDSGPGSLRQAIADANPGDRIRIPPGRFKLTTGQLLVDVRVRIKGAGARKTVVDGNDASRIFDINSAGSGSVISRLTIQNGNAGQDDGGGIQLVNAGLTLNRVAVKDNRVDFKNNFSGGGIDAAGTTRLVLRRSVVSGNRGYNGGGMDDISRLRVIDSTIARNTAGGPRSNGDGGAIEGAGSVTITDSTIAGNRCFNGPGCGGGLFADATVRGSIIAGNQAFEPNGKRAGSRGNPGKEDNCIQGLNSKGHNLEGRRDCKLTKSSDLRRTNPLLKKLANYGGQTDTMALRSSSPAVDAGGRKCTKADQRGVRRPQRRRCDIGAFELKKR
jgi:hypothetical protein